MRLTALLLLFLYPFWATGQIVSTSPPFPTSDQALTFVFNAQLGSGGLAGYDGDVYAHTGVITENSNSPSDWRYVKTDWGQNTPETRLERIGTDLYQLTISPDIRTFYGVPMNEGIEAVSLVFRSDQAVNGNYLEGKGDGFTDIFIDLYDDATGFLFQRRQPASQNVYEEGENIFVEFFTSQNADIRIFDNGTLVSEALATTSLKDTLTASSVGNHELVFEMTNGNIGTVNDTFNYVVPGPTPVAPLPDEWQLGAHNITADSVRFVMEAPGKSSVWLYGDFTGWKLDIENYAMQQTPGGKYFWLDVGGLVEGQFYRYQYVIDENLYLADPLSETVLDPNQDRFLGNTWPGLPDYPQAASGLVTLLKNGGYEYDFQFDRVDYSNEELVIYEILVRDFVDAQDFQTLTDTLDYFQKLGVNAIQLMPINEFEGNLSWGYNPSFHGAIDKYYGRPEDLKALIDAAHSRGIAVIIDVVYNHAFSQSPHCQMYWDAANFRPAPSNPWLNVTARHPFNVGYDYNHEYEGTQRYVKTTLERLLEEYQVDGFRFDLSKGFTQRQSNDVGQWNQYDAPRIARLKDYADYIWNLHPGAYVILEHLGGDQEERELSSYGMMLWNKQTEPYNEATMGFHSGGGSDFSRTYYPRRGFQEPHLISYMESHDEERLQYKNEEFGNSSGSYNIRELSIGLDRIEAATAFFYAIPGPKMLWQFGEHGYDYSINWCTNGTINPDCRTGLKPIRWDYYTQPDRFDLWKVTADMIHLKTETDLFASAQPVALDAASAVKRMRVGQDVIVLGNFDVQAQTVSLDFPQTGKWYEFFSGDSITLNDLAFSETFEPGEYRLYLRNKIARSSDQITSTFAVRLKDTRLHLYPNPSVDDITIECYGPLQQDLQSVVVMNASGQFIKEWRYTQGQRKISLRVSDLPSGQYFIILEGKNTYGVESFYRAE
jgi:hypothetical protein